MQEPRIRIILDANLDVDKHASSKECGAMSEAFLGDTQTCPETCEAKSLSTPAVSIYRLFQVESSIHTAVKKGLLEKRDRKLPSPDCVAAWTASFLCWMRSPDEGSPGGVLGRPLDSIPVCRRVNG